MAVVKAVIDTNIWVSSLFNPFGFPARLRTSFEDGDFNIVISVSMLEELADVLNSVTVISLSKFLTLMSKT